MGHPISKLPLPWPAAPQTLAYSRTSITPCPFRCRRPFSSCSLPSAPLRNRFPGGEEEEEEAAVLAIGQLAGHVKAKQTSCSSSWRRREAEVPAVSQHCIFSSTASRGHGRSCRQDATSQPVRGGREKLLPRCKNAGGGARAATPGKYHGYLQEAGCCQESLMDCSWFMVQVDSSRFFFNRFSRCTGLRFPLRCLEAEPFGGMAPGPHAGSPAGAPHGSSPAQPAKWPRQSKTQSLSF